MKYQTRFSHLAAAAVLAAGVAAAAPAFSADIPESPEPIKLAINEWTGQHITTMVAGELLKKMGYSVEYVTAGYQAQFPALEAGEITATLEIWSTQIGEIMTRGLDSGKVVSLGTTGILPAQEWYYPAYVEEMCPGLPDWTALKGCAELFATSESFPHGRFVDYPAEWGVNDTRIAALGLDLVSTPSGGEGSLIAEVKSAWERKAPLLVMFWAPHWLHAEYDMRVVALPTWDPACAEDPAWGPNPDTLWDCGWDKDLVRKVAWADMEATWPAAYKFLTAYQMTNAIQEPLMKRVDVDGEELLAVVNDWIDNNQSVWQPWIDSATQ